MRFLSAPIKRLFNVSRHLIDPESLGDRDVFHYSLPAWHEFGSGRVETASDLASSKLLIHGGEILVSKLNPEKTVVIHAEAHDLPTVCSTELIVLVPNETGWITNRFAYYLMLSAPIRHRLESSVESVTNSHKRARVERFLESTVSFPGSHDQQRIADFLDRETARIDELTEKKQKLVKLLEEKRFSLITVAVTKGLETKAPMKDSGIAWLGKVPEHWDVAPVYARYDVALGKMLDSKRVTGASLRPYVRNANVQWGFVDTQDLHEMDFAASERERYLLRPGDLLVCEGGEVGRTALWRGEVAECYYQKAIHRVRARTQKDIPRFFYYLMYSFAKSGIFVAGGNPNTIDHLTAEQLRHYRFPFPPRSEQREITDFLDGKVSQINSLVAKVGVTVDRLREFRSALITAAVTGQIDVDTWRKRGNTDRRLDAIKEEVSA